MCENCVATGRMTQAEADAQKAEICELLGMLRAYGMGYGMAPEFAVQQIGQEFTAIIARYGYELGVGKLDNENVAVGLVKSTDLDGPGDGYVMAEFPAENVMAEFSAENVWKMFDE